MKSRLIPALLLGIATATLGPVACNGGEESAAEVAPGTEAGILLASMDTSVDPVSMTEDQLLREMQRLGPLDTVGA